MDPSLGMGTNFWLKIFNGPQLGDFEGFLVGNCDGEVLRQLDGFLVQWSRSYVSCSIRRFRGWAMCEFWCFGGLGG